MRRLGQAGFLEQVLVVVEERRVDRERDADLATEALAVGLQDGGIDVAQVVVGLLDVGLQVEQLVAVRVEATEADRPDDVGRVAGGDLRAEDVVRRGVLVDLQTQRDLVLRLVEGRDDGLLIGDLVRLGARAQADEPADEDLAVGGQAALGPWRPAPA